jgi:sugar lactone lactonase YvrE
MNRTFEKIAGPFNSNLGGLLWYEDTLLFSLMDELLLQQWHPSTNAINTFRAYTGRMNGMALAKDGSIFVCQEGGRRIIQLQPNGSANVTATRFEGLIHNHPYDLVIDSKNRVWFSDPHSGTQAFGPQIFPPLPHASIMRLEKDQIGHWTIRRMSFDTEVPKAILLSADEKTLYVAENPSAVSKNRELRAYPILANGELGKYRVLHSFGSDGTLIHGGIHGLCKDQAGNIFASAGDLASGLMPAIYVFSPEGHLLEGIPFHAGVPQRITFSQNQPNQLYISSSDRCLYRVTI